MNRQLLIDTLGRYATGYPEEQKFISLFLELLMHPCAYQRDHLPGHITASAWITDESAANVLLLHHKKLDRWLQPGGHADGEEDVVVVATKEVMEETGLKTFLHKHHGLFDIDIHLIPARNEFPEHYHYDIRFLLQADFTTELIVSDESHALKWFPMEEVPVATQGSTSMIRMAEKAKYLLAADKH